MRTPRFLILALAVAVAAFSAGCSDDDDPPPTGGGGPTETFDSGVFNSGVFVHTYSTVGTFTYHCTVHGAAMMSGTINVVAGTPDSTTVAINNNSYSPTPATVNQGGYVKWVANGTNHSVTSP